jgi:hypothetical protein
MIMSEIRDQPPAIDASVWRALTDHGLEKPFTYLIRFNSSNNKYESINGSTGKIGESGTVKNTVITSVLNSMTSGTLFLKEVAFDLALFNSIPSGVRVVCSVGDESYTYINSADTKGSPYSINLGTGVNNGYYIVSDKNNQICYVSTSGTTILQNCADALKGTLVTATRQRANGIIQLNSDLNITGSLDFTDIQGTTFRGFSREDGTVIHIQSDEDVIFDLTSSRAIHFENIEFEVDAGYTPAVVFLLARDSSGDSVGNSIFSKCQFNDQGGITKAFFYNYGSEENLWETCTFKLNGRAAIFTDSNAENVVSAYTTIATGARSTSMNSFNSLCSFNCGLLVADEAILIYKGTSAFTVNNAYFGGGTKHAIGFNLTGGSIYKVTVTNCHFEMNGLLAVSDGSDRYLNSLSFTNNQILPVAGTFMDLDATKVYLRDSTINSLYNLGVGAVTVAFYMVDQCDFNWRCDPYRFNMTVTLYIRNSHIITYDTTTLTHGGLVAATIDYYGLIRLNRGTATFTVGNTQVTVNHGLSSTPTTVIVGVEQSEIAVIWWSANETQITFTVGSAVGGSRRVSWQAAY